MLGKKLFLIFAFLGALLSFQGVVAYDSADLTPEQHDLYLKVGNLLRCPTCTGLSVMESEASFSMQIRESVKEQVKLGKTEEEIMLFFQERYGLWIFREPPKQGVHLFAWFIPAGVVVVGGYLIWAMVWRRRKVFSTHGVRSSKVILTEMDSQLAELRASTEVKS